MNEVNEIIFYTAQKGKTPFDEWLNSFRDKHVRYVILNNLSKLRLGNFQNTKSVGHRVYEIKIHLGPGYRVYFSKVAGKVLILCAGDKGSQHRDIQKAIMYLQDFEERDDDQK